MVVVTFVSLMVHVYTIGYMAEDPGYQRFFSYISLFTFSMLMLVMANNFLQLFFGWEAVGLVSYLLIGFWYTRPTRDLREPEGVPGQPRRRLRLPARHRAGARVLRHARLRGGVRQRARRWRHDRDLPGAPWLLLTVICILPVRRRDGQERAVPAARLAARLDGRPDADLGADPRRDHGDRGHLHGGAHVAAVRAVARRRCRSCWSSARITAFFMALIAHRRSTTSSAWSRTRRCRSSAT